MNDPDLALNSRETGGVINFNIGHVPKIERMIKIEAFGWKTYA